MEYKHEVLFTERAQQLSTDPTTLLLYQILLGRDPENSFVIEEAKSQRIAALISSFLNSAEFDEFIRTPVRNGLRLRHELISPSPSSAQLAWIASLLALDQEQQETILVATTWREFFRALLPLDNIGPSLQNAVNACSINAVNACSIGRVEHVESTGIRGWALRLPVVQQAMEIECFVGANAVGHAVCTEYRPDLMELFGCNTHSGFTLNFDRSVSIETLYGHEIRLIDPTTKTIIDGSTKFELRNGTDNNINPRWVSTMRSKIASIDWQISRLKSLIDELAQQT